MKSESPQDNIERRSFIGSWIAVVPLIGSILAYTLTFVHEVAYCNVFHVPIELITLNWTTIIFALAAGSGGLFLVGWFYMTLFLFPRYSKKPMGSIEKRGYFLIVVFVMVFFVSIFLKIDEFIYTLMALIIMGVLLFCLPLLDKEARLKKDNVGKTEIGKAVWIRSLIRRYREILETYDEQQRMSTSGFPKYFDNIMVGLIIVALVFGVVYLEGRHAASAKDEFYIPSTNQNSVVLKIYGDNIICAPFTKLEDGIGIERRYFIIKMSENPNMELVDVKFEGKIKVRTEPYLQK